MRGDKRGGDVLKHYNGVVHRRLFSLSKPLMEAMKSDGRVMTEFIIKIKNAQLSFHHVLDSEA